MRAGIIDDDVAVFGEPDADNQVAAAAGSFAFETIVGNGCGDREAGFDPIFQFGNVGEAADIGAHAVETSRKSSVAGPVAGAFVNRIVNGFRDFGDGQAQFGAI